MVETESSSPASMSRPVSGESNSFLTVDDRDNQTKSDHQQPEASPPTKRKRNLPGMPDPDAEVIALSPKTLLATNRFVCEICNKGFQRDQNLQLHRRGHNLPWKLRQRSSGEAARKRVYVCPEPTCAHHDPSRALGDLTGIKKHFCRKHGEKKFKCDRCSKTYAVRSDWKAHMKTCGTREYPCDCGTLFSRRDTFITHRAFCYALAQENSPSQPPPTAGGDLNIQAVATPPTVAASSPPPPPLTPPTGKVSPVLSVQSLVAELPENQNAHLQPPPPPQGRAALTTAIAPPITATASSSSTTSSIVPSTGGTIFAATLSPSTSETHQSSQGPTSYPSLLCPISGPSQPGSDPMSLSLCPSFYGPPSFLPSTSQNHNSLYLSGPQPALSATALLQKAAQMSSTSSGSSFLCELGLTRPSSSGPKHDISALDWNSKVESSLMASGLGLASGWSLGLNNLMMGPSILSEKPPTLDFLGLGMRRDDQSRPVGFSAFLSSMGGGGLSDMGNDSFGGTWGGESPDLKPSL